MIVYVITIGEYSDYSICGVAIDKKRAERIRDFVSDKWNQAEIEEYDTENWKQLEDGKKAYKVSIYDNGSVYCDPALYYYSGDASSIKEYCDRWSDNSYHLLVWAKSEEHAKKIAQDRVAELKYRNAMGETL